MHAIILSIGDELVLGQTVDTNSAYLSAELVKLGIGTLYHQTIADDRAAIARAIRQACEAGPLVLITGGLGPTEDDLTREALADALGVELVEHLPSVEAIRSLFARRNRQMPERNRVQALHPRGSDIIPNTCGTAPGIRARRGQATIYVTPGVPSEMLAMWRLALQPEIAKLGGDRGVILTCKINTFGLGESTVAERLGPQLMDRDRNPKVGTTVAGGVVSVRLRSEFDDPALAQRELDDTIAQVESKLGAYVYGRNEDLLQEGLLRTLKERDLTLATAESCTGGLIGAMLTDIAGSSAVYRGGWVTYSNAMKTVELGVRETMLTEHGAVSAPVALAMAHGARERSGADVTLAITGIAGPDGGTAQKPVGTVYFALSGRAGARPGGAPFYMAFHCLMSGDRQAIRDRSARTAMQTLRLLIAGATLDDLSWARRVA